MKNILLVLTCITGYSSYAQWNCSNIITFDPGDSLYPAAITIDTTIYHHNMWQVGKPHKTVFSSALSLPNVMVTDTSNPYPINDTSVFILTAPLSLSNDRKFLEIQFSYQLDIDSTTQASIEISTDKGLHWNNVADSLPASFYWDGDTAHLSSPTNGWAQFFLAYRCPGCVIEGDSMLSRFTLVSGSIPSAKDGWMIDNINLSYWCDSLSGSIAGLYPNPAISELNISASAPIASITIINVLGQVLFSSKYNNNVVQINVDALPAAIYFIKINGANYREVKKFVKR